MPLPRFQLLELEDVSWFPGPIRRAMTEYLAEVSRRTRPYAPAVPILADWLRRQNARRVLDLCSGSGGPWPELISDLRQGGLTVELELSDRFPNPDATSRFAERDHVSYREGSLSATSVPPGTEDARTIFSGFHHFAPREAREVLANAVAAGRPIAIFEATHRSILAVVAMTLVPILVLVITPAIRPFRWSRLLFTYLVPIVPLAAWWDGVVSCLRTYRPEELLAMGRSASPAGAFEWSAGEVRAEKGPLPVTWLTGNPVRLGPGKSA